MTAADGGYGPDTMQSEILVAPGSTVSSLSGHRKQDAHPLYGWYVNLGHRTHGARPVCDTYPSMHSTINQNLAVRFQQTPTILHHHSDKHKADLHTLRQRGRRDTASCDPCSRVYSHSGLPLADTCRFHKFDMGAVGDPDQMESNCQLGSRLQVMVDTTCYCLYSLGGLVHGVICS